MLRLLIPPVLIVVAATVLGLSFNALRPHPIDIGRLYFAALPDVPAAPPSGAPAPVPAAGAGAAAAVPTAPAAPSPGALALAARARVEFELADAALVHRCVEAIALDPSGVVLLDARDGQHFREGHIRGALHLDYFNLSQDIQPSLPFLQHLLLFPMPMPSDGPPPQPRFASDDWIGKPRQVLPLLLVYCESDECEDGFNLCRTLRDDYGIDKQRIVLYLGGMRDWRQRQLPVVPGGELW